MSQPEPIKAVLPRMAKMIAEYSFPNGSIFRCIPCGKQRNCTTSEIAEGIANGWPKCKFVQTHCGVNKPVVRTKELNGQFAVTHGMAGTKQSRRATVYSVWHKMKQRCLNPNDTRFKDYGGRGITCCPEWIRFEAFYRDMGDPPLGHQLDRIDNDKGYSPENCRWVDRSTQQNNRRTNVVITVDGESLTATEWSRRLGLKPITILMRIKRGLEPC